MARAMAGRLVQLLAEGRGGDASGKSGEAIERLAEKHDGVLGSVWRWSQRCSLAMEYGDGGWRCLAMQARWVVESGKIGSCRRAASPRMASEGAGRKLVQRCQKGGRDTR